jgi:carbon storage regulator
MLVLSRKVGERVLIGENIVVTIVRVHGNGVRIGIEAPPEMAVVREELQQRMQNESSTPPLESSS